MVIEKSSSFSPGIYYLHPLLAGVLREWDAHLDRCAELGFDHVLVAPLFAPGHVADIFLTADDTSPHPALGWQGDAHAAIGYATEQCRARGLRMLMDLVINRVAADSTTLAAHPQLFEPADRLAALDPRAPAGAFGAVRARWDQPEAAAGLVDLWAERVLGWAAAGVAGVRIDSLHGVPPAGLRALIEAVHRQAPEVLFLGWTPGLPRPALAGLRGAGLDGVFSSLPWWDFRAGWLWDEAAALRPVAPIVAAPEAPFGPRLAAAWRDPATLEAACRRAIGCAAALESGWLMPMGFEYAARGPLRAGHGRAEDFIAAREAAPFDLSEAIVAANARRTQAADCGGGAVRLLSGPGADVIALLRAAAPDLRGASQAALVLANVDLAAPHEISASALLPGAAGPFGHFEDATERLRPGEALRVDPGEVRVMQAVPATPVQRRPPPAGPAVRAAAKAPRIAIEDVSPCVTGGSFPVRRVMGESVTVEADLICDGHDMLAAMLLWRAEDEGTWNEAPMRPLGNDRWQARFPLGRPGRHQFAIEAWRDVFATFRDELAKKHAAGLPLAVEIEEGRQLVLHAVRRSAEPLRGALATLADSLEQGDGAARRVALMADTTAEMMRAADDRPFRSRTEQALVVDAERAAAGFASWYELFPRSMSDDPTRHGTFADVIRHLPRIRDMGFDVLYFPPIHPIGRTNRKGRNNAPSATPEDPGSPYAIGAEEGGHDSIHPELGTLEDFRRLREAALAHGLELALDFAIQCSPDHPWLRAHPDWFDWRPDGSLRYAENPPKKYEDIVNVDFYRSGAVPGLWMALRDVVLFWLGEGVRIFRVDNPHTKPLPFWQWLIADVRGRDPGAIFLSEAFTRPKMMYRLAKIGFSQSYTYFTWRNTKAELEAYFTELTTGPAREFFRPHLFVNTPDINPRFLQDSGRAGFLIRAALAATLSSLWGVYSGFELCEAAPLPGREEYLDSEKYEMRVRDWTQPGHITAEITRLNRIRRDNPALWSHLGLRFYHTANDTILLYGKATEDRSNALLIAVSLDPYNVQETDFELPLWEWGLPDSGTLRAEDLMEGSDLLRHGKQQHLRLDPAARPFAIWRLNRPR